MYELVSYEILMKYHDRAQFILVFIILLVDKIQWNACVNAFVRNKNAQFLFYFFVQKGAQILISEKKEEENIESREDKPWRFNKLN